ncbi:MAG: ABC transporter ATP-binding protein [Sandaracinaceae bacterium]
MSAWSDRREQLVRLGGSLRRTVALVWGVNRGYVALLAGMALLGGVLPAGIAYVGKRIVDQVVEVFFQHQGEPRDVVMWVGIELVLVLASRGFDRLEWLTEETLRIELGQHINERILEKALDLELADFEDSNTYDQLSKARRGASYRPLSVVKGSYDIVRHAIALVSYGVLLWQLAPWALVIVVVAAVPEFIADLRYSESSFRLFSWRAPETRRQMYYESLLTNAAYTKEVKLFDLGGLLLGRYRAIFQKHFQEDRARTLAQAWRAYLFGAVSVVAFYGAYAWIAVKTAEGELTFGDMTMYLLVFRQAQTSLYRSLDLVRSQYEHMLYLRELFSFLDREPARVVGGTRTSGPDPDDGLRMRGVEFRYPDADALTLAGIDLHLRPREKLALVGENGAGKTTLIKLMVGLYRPTAGTITLDGLDLAEWEPRALRRRVGVIFQDFVQYHLLAGENVGAGDVEAFDDEARWRTASAKGLADAIIEALPDGYQTPLGKWFENGRELSGGQWQKIALSRAFMREDAQLLILDEPTASMDAEAETRIFERFGALAEDRMAVIISHRFSTVRMADTIVVIEGGRIVEKGSHEQLVAQGGRYAHLFALQARGYR